MPLLMEKGRVPTHWVGEKTCRLVDSEEEAASLPNCIKITLINNMPDAALEDTEAQFFELLDAASDRWPVFVKLHSLANVPRGDRAQQHLKNFYRETCDLLNVQCDGVIMTGTEPHHADLRAEPYWDAMVSVLEWAEQNTFSTVLSCLAAHAGVLHSDGIVRSALVMKRFGVFQQRKACDHPLTFGTDEPICIPHSRWNEVREDALNSCGYRVLTQSPEAGVDLFVKEKKDSLFVHFQGHPEYARRTLLKEYRRDVKRYLRKEKEVYPGVPHDYFDPAAVQLLDDFREKAFADRCEGILERFPEADIVDTLQKPWHAPSTQIYRNWLDYIASKKNQTQRPSRLAHVAGG